MTDVYLNGNVVGSVDEPYKFVAKIREQRRKGKISEEVNIAFDPTLGCVFVECSQGRARRPLVVVKEGKSLVTKEVVEKLKKGDTKWEDLIKNGLVEYLDPLEEEDAFVSFYEEELTPEHTHLELVPFSMLGLCASLVPFCNYSPGARISMGAKNQKQAIGVYIANYPIRSDMDVNTLNYPQIPIVKTAMADVSKIEAHPLGQNFIVAISNYEGYNMDDAVVLNRGSIDRGLARSTYYRPAVAEEMRYPGGLFDKVEVPDKDVKGYKSETDYRFLEEDGIVFPEAKVSEEDVVIGRTSPPRFLASTDQYNLISEGRRESSVQLKHGEQGIIDTIFITEGEEGHKLVEVKLRSPMIPEIGDKFVSRHGQKGVVGLIVNPENMPFSECGIVPDLIFSPHSIPSRMTFSHMIDLLSGKVGALSARQIDGTPFSSENIEDIRKELTKNGFRDNGVETFFNPLTGEQKEMRIFVGNMYYLRLKHLVANKIHARARGPVQLLTRQPTEGRAKEGGLRLGEMEKDTFVAHGASMVLKERFNADSVRVPVCEKCGMFAYYDRYKNRHVCSICGDNIDVSYVEISYAFKLFTDELRAMCLNTKYGLKTRY
ncbi:MAG TPA: DNA-directed RNA polymerase subunit B [Candidatus Woesearchaeota archaeon]|nr:DNA-directed RNA polymerase subunit B [Candidatus Woesearchaeota archaeon]